MKTISYTSTDPACPENQKHLVRLLIPYKGEKGKTKHEIMSCTGSPLVRGASLKGGSIKRQDWIPQAPFDISTPRPLPQHPDRYSRKG